MEIRRDTSLNLHFEKNEEKNSFFKKKSVSFDRDHQNPSEVWLKIGCGSEKIVFFEEQNTGYFPIDLSQFHNFWRKLTV